VHHQRRVLLGKALRDLLFDPGERYVLGATDVTGVPLMLLPDIDDVEGVLAGAPGGDIRCGLFLDLPAQLSDRILSHECIDYNPTISVGIPSVLIPGGYGDCECRRRWGLTSSISFTCFRSR